MESRFKSKISKILKSGDKYIQQNEISTAPIDNDGFMRMKNELESMGLVVEYKRIFKTDPKKGYLLRQFLKKINSYNTMREAKKIFHKR